jgi:protocatechuate 3,4-dioxygenase beta subunit
MRAAIALAVTAITIPLGAQQAAAPSLLPAGEPGTPLSVEGRIVGPSGPVAGAALYVYQTDARGYYSGEVDDDPRMARTQSGAIVRTTRAGVSSNRKPRLKARFATGPDGRFAFRTIMPGQYPRSGPPAHIHLEVTPPGKAMEQFELVFDGDSRLTDSIRADAKVGKFYAICAPATGAGGVMTCTDVTFRVQ